MWRRMQVLIARLTAPGRVGRQEAWRWLGDGVLQTGCRAASHDLAAREALEECFLDLNTACLQSRLHVLPRKRSGWRRANREALREQLAGAAAQVACAAAALRAREVPCAGEGLWDLVRWLARAVAPLAEDRPSFETVPPLTAPDAGTLVGAALDWLADNWDPERPYEEVRGAVLGLLASPAPRAPAPPALTGDLWQDIAAWIAFVWVQPEARVPLILPGALASALASPNLEERPVAATALAALGPGACTPVVVKELLWLLNQPASLEWRRAAAWLLSALGPWARRDSLVRALDTALVHTLAAFPGKPPTEARADRRAFTAALAGLGATPPSSLTSALHGLNSKGASMRLTARGVLAALEELAATPAVLDAMLQQLNQTREGPAVGRATVRLLERLAPAAPTPNFLNGLLVLARRHHPRARRLAVRAFRTLGPGAAQPTVLAELARDLGTERPGPVRHLAARLVQALGAAAASPPILTGLTGLLLERNRSLRQAGLRALAALGERAATPAVLTDLASQLRSRRPRGACQAVATLCRGSVTPEILDGLAHLLRRHSPHTLRAALQAVAALGPLATAEPALLRGLLAALRHRDEEVRQSAAVTVGALEAGVPDDFLHGLVAVMHEHVPMVRRAALEAVRRRGAHAATAAILRRVQHHLADEEGGVRATALRAALSLGLAGHALLLPRWPALLHDADTCTAALIAVTRLGASACTPELLEVVEGWLQGGTAFGRLAATRVVTALGPAAATPGILAGLAGALARGGPFTAEVAQAVLALGSGATPALVEGILSLVDMPLQVTWLPALLAALRQPDTPLRKVLLPRLPALLQAESRSQRRLAAQVACHFGAAAASAEVLATLTNMLRHGQASRRRAALRVTAALGEHASCPGVLAGLQARLSDGGARERRLAFRALACVLRSPSLDTERVLLPLLYASDSEQRRLRIQLLRRLDPRVMGDPVILAALQRRLAGGAEAVRVVAARALGDVPFAITPEVEADLARALRDPARGVRRGAIRALRRLACHRFLNAPGAAGTESGNP